MEILPLPSSNEPITNVVRYLSQPPVIVQKAMAGQARAPGPGPRGDRPKVTLWCTTAGCEAA